MALNRGDLDVAFALYHPEVEPVWDPALISLGFEMADNLPSRIESQRRWMAEWDDFRVQPEQLIDLGDSRVLLLARMAASGRRSGLSVDTEVAFLVTVPAGRVIREQVWLDHGKALEAVGLSE